MKTALSHVCTKLVAALLLFGLSAASIAADVALNKPATQTSTINRGLAHLAVDNNWNTYALTSSDRGQYWEVDLSGQYSTAIVSIVGRLSASSRNRQLFYRTSFGTSKLEFMLGTRVVQTVNLVSSYPESPAQRASQQISSSPNVVFDRVRLHNVEGQGLTLSTVQVDAQPYVDNGPNVALGKPTFQTSTIADGFSDLAVNGSEDGYVTHTNNGPREYWEADLLFPYKISTISIVNRKDCCADRILGATLQVLSGTSVVYSRVIGQSDLGTNPYLEFNVPAGTAGNRVRVLNKPNEYLSLAEVRVNGVYSYPFPTEGAPGAVMSFKSGEFLGQPGLLNGGLPRSAYAMIKGVNDAVNVSPPLAGYGAATITNSASVQNQTLVPNGKNENIAEISTFAFGLAQPTRIKFRAGLDTGKASSLVINGVPITLQMYSQWWEGNWGMLNDIGWTEFVDLPAGNHTFQVYGVENCCSDPQSFQYQIEGGQWTNFSANDPVLAVRAFGDVFFTPDDKTYHSLSTFTLPPKASGGYETLFFKVRARNDAHIKLGCFRNNIDVFYEIVLGGWSNTVSVMRPIHNTNYPNGPDGARLDTPNILSGNEDRDFWVSTDGATNTIRVGRGTDPTQGQFMSWANPPYFPWTGSDRVPLCFQLRTGWGSTGTWSGIRNTTTVTQQAIANYPSFLATFPPPPGAGVLFDPNWVNQQWTSSNQDPETFQQKLREQANEEIKTQQTFPETTTTLGDVIDSFNTLSNYNLSDLFHPNMIDYLKKLGQPSTRENNLLIASKNKTILIGGTPVPIFSPGTTNRNFDGSAGASAAAVPFDGSAGVSAAAVSTSNAVVGGFYQNWEYAVLAQTNVLLPLKRWSEGASPFDINVAFGVPLLSISGSDYLHQGEPNYTLNNERFPMKFGIGLIVDGLEYLEPGEALDNLKKVMGVSFGGSVKAQFALLCDKSGLSVDVAHFPTSVPTGACQMQTAKLFVQLKGGIEVVKAFQAGFKAAADVYVYLGGKAAQLVEALRPTSLIPFLTSDPDGAAQFVSAQLPDTVVVNPLLIGENLPAFTGGSTELSTRVGAAFGSGDQNTMVSSGFRDDQASAAAGDPTTELAGGYSNSQSANYEASKEIADSIAAGYNFFCNNTGETYRLECTNDAKLDLTMGLQWTNANTLKTNEFDTEYGFRLLPDALKASFVVRLTPGWEGRFNDFATFKLRIIPAWTYSFLYIPLSDIGIKASPRLTSEDD